MDTDNISAAGMKAIEAGGTNNVLIGKSLRARGVMVEAAAAGYPDAQFRYVLSVEYVAFATGETVETVQEVVDALDSMDEERKFAEAMEREENEADEGSHEKWAIEQENARLRMDEIEALSDEYLTADVIRCDEIAERLRELGAEPPLVNEDGPDAPPNADAALVLAVRADEKQAREDILAPVRDPRETRYAHVERWTDDNLEIKYGILHHRLMRRTLRKADRMQAERQCQAVENELLRRGIRPNRNR